jgi:MFS family permease
MWLVAAGAWSELARGLFVLGVAAGLVGIGFLVAVPSWQAAVSHIDPRKSGSYLGAVMTAQGLGAILGASVGGALFDRDKYLPIVACAAVLTIGAVVSPLAMPKPKAESSPEPPA